MLSINLFTVSEARANLFRLLKLAAAGEAVVIVNQETGQRFSVSLFRDGKRSGRSDKQPPKPRSEHEREYAKQYYIKTHLAEKAQAETEASEP